MQQSINISCLPGAQQQTCTSALADLGFFLDGVTLGTRASEASEH